MIQKEYDDGKKHVHVLSYGGGTQSTALLLMALEGKANGVIPDHIIISDTGWEPKAVYDWIDKIKNYVLDKYGKEIHVTSGGNIREDLLNNTKNNFTSMPIHYRNEDGSKGMGFRQCTREYKITPVNKKIRELLGYVPKQRVKEIVHVWKGISSDEIQRAKPMRDKWQVAEHPLIDIFDMDRNACVKYVEDSGLGTPPRSACIGCPFNINARWRDLKGNDPESWADAVMIDKRLREFNPNGYLHTSLKPLEDAHLGVEQLDIDLFINECEGMCGV